MRSSLPATTSSMNSALGAVLKRRQNAIRLLGIPQKISIDGCPANKAAILEIEVAAAKPIKLRQIKYLLNLIEQDNRAAKRIVRPMLGFKSWPCSCILIPGIETMRMACLQNKVPTCLLQSSSIH